MLRDRLFSASVLISTCVIALLLDQRLPLWGTPGLWLVPLLLAFAGGTAWEMSRLIERSGRPVRQGLATAATLLIVAAASLPIAWPLFGSPYPTDCPVGRLGWPVIGGIAGVGLLVLAEMAAFGRQPAISREGNSARDANGRDENPRVDAARAAGTSRAASGTLVAIYVGLPMALLVIIRNLGNEANWGLAALVSMIVVTKASDTGAYFTGRMLGKHKMIPLLSPGKTWEGAIGGVGLSIAAAYLCFFKLFPLVTDPVEVAPFWGAPVFGVACAVSGMLGDLAESFFKRDGGVKDSGGLLPGMGGIWDVTDSLIGAALPAFLCFAAGAAGR